MNRKYLQPKRIFKLMLYPDKYSGEIFRTNTFKKDFKNVVKGHQFDLTEFFVMLLWIQKGLPMPESFRKHRLEGVKKFTIDVHVEPNLVLSKLSENRTNTPAFKQKMKFIIFAFFCLS